MNLKHKITLVLITFALLIMAAPIKAVEFEIEERSSFVMLPSSYIK